MAGKTTREQAQYNSDLLLEGNLLAIDPSSTSFGWAVFKNGKFKDSGVKKYKGAASVRLNRIYTDVYLLAEKYGTDILGIERLRSKGGYSPPQLLWSVGVTMAAAPVPVIEVSPQSWKAIARAEDIDKSDDNDAYCIGKVLILMAKGEY